MAQVRLTFNPALRITLAVFDSARTGQTDDGTLRQLVDGLPTGHAPHVEGQSILGCLLSLQGDLDIKLSFSCHHDEGGGRYLLPGPP